VRRPHPSRGRAARAPRGREPGASGSSATGATNAGQFRVAVCQATLPLPTSDVLAQERKRSSDRARAAAEADRVFVSELPDPLAPARVTSKASPRLDSATSALPLGTGEGPAAGPLPLRAPTPGAGRAPAGPPPLCRPGVIPTLTRAPCSRPRAFSRRPGQRGLPQPCFARDESVPATTDGRRPAPLKGPGVCRF
jgi:hypothetical protein